MNYKNYATLAAALLTVSAANADWKYGIGTGIGASSYDGDLKVAGASYDVDFDQGDFEGGFGGAAFATNGTWTFTLSGGTIDYEAKETIKGTSIRSKNEFTNTGVELTAGYTFYNEGSVTITPFAGVSYTDHEWEFDGSGLDDVDDDWTDALIGINLDYKINEKWTWKNSAKYSFGDSEGCFGLQTGAAWHFAEHWIAGANISYESNEFETSGSEEYEYDTDVTSLGLTITFIW